MGIACQKHNIRSLITPRTFNIVRKMTKIKLAAKIENLRQLIEFVSNSAKGYGFASKKIRQIELATEEALVNICNYAYPEEPGEVEVRCKMEDGDRFIMEIIDRGIPFDNKSLCDPDLTLTVSEREMGGLGIFLIRKMVDEVQYRRDGDRNTLTFMIQKN